LNKPIIENDYFNFDNFFYFISKNLKRILRFYFYGLVLFTIYFFLKTPEYSSKVSFYTNYIEVTQSSFLSPLLGDLSGLQSGGLNFSIANYLDSEKFLEDIVKKQYNIDEQEQTLVDYWVDNYNNFLVLNPISLIRKINKNLMFNRNLSHEEKMLEFSKTILRNKISHSEDRKSAFNTITVTTRKYPSLSKDIISEIYKSVISYSNEVTNVKAVEKRRFIEERLITVKSDLENSENGMLNFMENNKSLNSPNLVLQRGRIQRDITLYNQLYLSLSDKLEIAKIDEKDNTSSVFLLDFPITNSYKSGFSLLEIIVYLFILCFTLILGWGMYKNKNNLFL